MIPPIMRSILITSLLFVLPACATGTQAEMCAPENPGTPALLLDSTRYEQFGGGAYQGETLAVADVLANPASFAGKKIRVTGTVREICQQKGCWMRVGGEQEQGQVFVKFLDYAFFMPLDGAGREAVMEGELSVVEISVETARHYLEDAGKPEEAAKITEPQKQIRFMASGVALTKPAAK